MPSEQMGGILFISLIRSYRFEKFSVEILAELGSRSSLSSMDEEDSSWLSTAVLNTCTEGIV